MNLSDLHYRPFRRDAISRLVSKNPAQHGVLVNHMMGTGKTTIGVLFALNFPNFKKIIVVPTAAQAEWTELLHHHKCKHVSIFDYVKLHTLPKLGSGTIVICDEAHNLVSTFTGHDHKTQQSIFKNLKSCRKILLLTGTPIRNHISDISLLINIAAGKTLLPTNKATFEQQFYQINRKLAVTKGYIDPIIMKPTFRFLKKTLITTMLYALVSAVAGHIIAFFAFRKKFAFNKQQQRMFEMTQQVLNDKFELKHENIQDIQEKLKTKDFFEKKNLITYLNQFSDDQIYGKSFWNTLFFLPDALRNQPKTTDTKTLQTTTDKENEAKKKQQFRDFYDEIQTKMEPQNQAATVKYFLVFLVCKLSHQTCMNDTDTPQTHTDWLQKQIDDAKYDKVDMDMFPLPQEQDKSYESYNYKPVVLLIQFVIVLLQGFVVILRKIAKLDIGVCILLFVYLAELSYNKHMETKTIFNLNVQKLNSKLQSYLVTYDPFLSKDQDMLTHFPEPHVQVMQYHLTIPQTELLQRIMLNLVTEQDLVNLGVGDKDDLIQSSMTMDSMYTTLGRMVGNVGASNKFDTIIRMHREHPKTTVIWSNFSTALINFEQHAVRAGFTVRHYQASNKPKLLADLLARRYDFLLLPPHAFEGVSLGGVEVLHILEPCDDVVQFNQLKARIVRYVHKTPKLIAKHVHIMQWIGVMSQQRVKRVALRKIWSMLGKYQSVQLFKEQLPYDASPDSRQWKKIQLLQQQYEAMYVSLMTTSGSLSSKQRCVPLTPKNFTTNPQSRKSCIKLYEKFMTSRPNSKKKNKK